MRSRTDRNRALAAALGILLVSGAFAGLGALRETQAQSLSTASTSSIDVTATTSLSYAPNEFQDVATNTSISLSFTDASSLAHTFTIIGKEGWVIPSTISPTDFDKLVYGKSPKVLYNLNISSAGTTPGNFTSPGPGWYEFVCTEPGHFASGMYGFIAFGMNLPSNLTVSSGSPGPGAALFIIIGTIATLVVVALVLGFVAGRRKGAQHEMPPERLGYAEPPAGNEPLRTSSDEARHP